MSGEAGRIPALESKFFGGSIADVAEFGWSHVPRDLYGRAWPHIPPAQMDTEQAPVGTAGGGQACPFA